MTERPPGTPLPPRPSLPRSPPGRLRRRGPRLGGSCRRGRRLGSSCRRGPRGLDQARWSSTRPPGTRSDARRPPPGESRRRRRTGLGRLAVAAQSPVWDEPVAEQTPAWETSAVEAPAWDVPDSAEAPTLGGVRRRRVRWDQTAVDDEPAWQAPVVADERPGPDVALRHAGTGAGGHGGRSPCGCRTGGTRPDVHVLQRLRRLGRSCLGRVPAVRAHARRGTRLAHRCHADRPGGGRRGARAGRARRARRRARRGRRRAGSGHRRRRLADARLGAADLAVARVDRAAGRGCRRVPSRSPSRWSSPSSPSSTVSRSVPCTSSPTSTTSSLPRTPTSHPSPSPSRRPSGPHLRRRRPSGPPPCRRRRRPGRRSRPRTSRSRHRRSCSRPSRPKQPSSRSPHRRHPSTRRPRSPTRHPRPPCGRRPARRPGSSDGRGSGLRRSPSRSRTTPRVAASGACSAGRRVTRPLPRSLAAVPVQNAPAPVSQVAPVRTSAWTAESAGPQSPTGADSSQSWMASTTWSAPAAPAPHAPASLEPVSAGSWAPPEWAARPGANAAPSSTVPQPALPPSVAPRVGTLDDEVAAMLALRSDIQEQALSELSQLSAYRPAATGGNAERLTKRVPTAVPATTVAEDEGKPVQRDADQLRVASVQLPVRDLTWPSCHRGPLRPERRELMTATRPHNRRHHHGGV